MKIPSLLEQLTGPPLERPCAEPWDAMQGDDRVRHCGACARDVYDLSAMSAREAEIRLLNAGQAAPCIRYARRHDGALVHQPEPPVPYAITRPAAAPRLAAAAALGVTLTASTLHAKESKKAAPTAPAQCVAYLKQADVDGNAVLVASAQPAPSSGAGAAAAAPPAAAPPAAPPPAAAAQPATPPQPIPLGGAPPPIQEQPTYGTLSVKSKIARDVTVLGIKLHAPVAAYLLTPGDFALEVTEANGKSRVVKFRITPKKTTVVDLDKK